MKDHLEMKEKTSYFAVNMLLNFHGRHNDSFVYFFSTRLGHLKTSVVLSYVQ